MNSSSQRSFCFISGWAGGAICTIICVILQWYSLNVPFSLAPLRSQLIPFGHTPPWVVLNGLYFAFTMSPISCMHVAQISMDRIGGCLYGLAGSRFCIIVSSLKSYE